MNKGSLLRVILDKVNDFDILTLAPLLVPWEGGNGVRFIYENKGQRVLGVGRKTWKNGILE